MKKAKYILLDKNGYIISIAEKKLSDEFIEIEEVPQPYQIYKMISGKLQKDKNREEEYIKLQKENKKRKVSKIVTQYINDLLKYLDYDNLADLIICENMPLYKDEVQKIKNWIEEVYKKYEIICEKIDSDDIDISNVENELPKYKG